MELKVPHILVEEKNSPDLFDLINKVANNEIVANVEKNKVDLYLEDGCVMDKGDYFKPISWWKDQSLKFHILLRLAIDVLAIPITCVVSEDGCVMDKGDYFKHQYLMF
ncbi:hypothetical protein F3Y22_tig00109919pilonHSYRG00046 [Hibiscus syriacus]|uniref:HAT C-terminal dimerisation domain-containing protein n=1 Tax=Hibiscus syriacus TaxID=106335 RepID=A0A6A3BYT1_HIBSY|nr:hypothetical protein F3Y22_tig00109919pilonHSYRG00046 [Hibiscus syriacus]